MELLIQYFNYLNSLNKELLLFIALNILETSFKMRCNPTSHELSRTDDWDFILHIANNRTVYSCFIIFVPEILLQTPSFEG